MSATGEGATCMACRGTGKVTSGLGGTPHEVTCPWCEGTGRRIPGLDAQQHPSEGGADRDSDAAPADGEAVEENAGAEDDDLS
jgi:DnaJ-class molecular chaperone